jgi:hypothetical protein
MSPKERQGSIFCEWNLQTKPCQIPPFAQPPGRREFARCAKRFPLRYFALRFATFAFEPTLVATPANREHPCNKLVFARNVHRCRHLSIRLVSHVHRQGFLQFGASRYGPSDPLLWVTKVWALLKSKPIRVIRSKESPANEAQNTYH